MANLNNDNSGVYTALEKCCSTLEQDFAFTWTILNGQSNSGIYTALDRCCSILQQDFAFTWTILAAQDSSGIYTAFDRCCSILQQDFAFTWTILNNINNSTNITGVYTALDKCCSTLQQDFAFTWTILNNINNSTDITGVYTALNYLAQTQCSPTIISQAMIGTTGYTISIPGEYKIDGSLTFAPGAAADMITIGTSNVHLDLGCGTLGQTNATASVNAVRVASGLEDVLIINGHIGDFTGYGIVGSDSERVFITNGIIHSCSLGAFSFLGTSSSAMVDDLLIENCQIEYCAQGSGGSATIRVDYGENIVIRSVQIFESGATDHDINVIDLRNNIAGEVKDVHIGGTSAKDEMNLIHCKDTSQSGFIEIELRNNNSLGNARGFFMDSSTTCSANIFADCTVQLLTGTAQVQAFSVNNDCDNNSFENCEALLCRSTGTGATAIVYGFAFQNNKNNYLIECLVNGNTSSTTSAAIDHGAYGFDFNTTYSCTALECLSANQSDAVAAPPASGGAIGFRINNGSRNSFYRCISEGQIRGFRILGTNTAHIFIQNQATKNSVNYTGFPGGSTDAAATIAGLNALNNPWTNIGVG